MKRRLRKGITVNSTSTASNGACFDDDESGGDVSGDDEIEQHTLLQQHVDMGQNEGMKMKKMMERKRGLGSKHGNNKRESSNTSSMMKHNSHNAVQDDGEEDSSILSDEEAEVQKEEVIVEEVEEEEEEVVEEEEEEEEEEEQGGEGTKMWDAMNRILGKSLKEEFNEKPVLALRKTKAMKEMDDEKLKWKRVEDKKVERRRKLARQMVGPRSADPEKERLFRKVATRGVVALFNAIADAQHSKNETPVVDEEENVQKESNKSGTEAHHIHHRSGVHNAKMNMVSKSSFLDLLRKKTQEESLEASSGDGRLLKKDEMDGPGGSTWSVLRDDYMLGSVAMKDWDKENT